MMVFVFKAFCYNIFNGLKIKHELFYRVCYNLCNNRFGAPTTSKDASIFTASGFSKDRNSCVFKCAEKLTLPVVR
ncbi:hypothetical protein HanXRQr2_Chr06g0272951 [Helianthus annuus]|uniref:Uncharacterized protein n=1 Tax=Helianthus annuus TaxID=4232 RepID=A0A9K3NK58_HELAN|nr:hypothetical protein HanXRQr2_Chr06g0272951 [Helianthus annuus]KAJ0916585.1 hypothetical protein HanPSC8_Chr06g0263441 [Helianthus annuus]